MLFLIISLLAVPRAYAGASAAAPPAVAPAAALPAALLPELTPELLKRWGYDADRVLALDPDKRAELQRELARLEIGRLRRLELLRAIKPQDWRGYVDDNELLTPAGMKLVDDWLAKRMGKPLLVPAKISAFERADGKPLTAEDMARARQVLDRVFDGTAAQAGAKDMSGDVIVDAHVRNETVYDVTITNPKSGFSFSAGQLFADGNQPLAQPSPYANATWGKDSKPDSGVDYRIKASLGYVDLHSRFFADAPNPAVNQAFALGSQLGLGQDKMRQMAAYATYDDPYEAHGIIVTSLLAEMGRAYHLAGPVDLSWTTGALIKTMWVAPNAAFDETLGLRVKLKDGLSVGFFGGVAQNVSPIGNQLLQEALADGAPKPGFYLENDPHASAAVWGAIPGASDLRFSATATQRWTNETQVREGELSLMSTFQHHPIALKGAISRENGTTIEFERDRARLEADYGITKNAQAFLGLQHDDVKYGNASLASNSVLAGFKMEFGGDGGDGSTLTVDQLMGGRYAASPLNAHFSEQLAQIQGELNAAVDAAQKANEAYQRLRPGLDPGAAVAELDQLSRALSRLDPAAAAGLIDQLQRHGLTSAQTAALRNIWLRTVSPGAAYSTQIGSLLDASAQSAAGADRALGRIDDWSKYFTEHELDIRRLIGLLTDERVWDSAVIQTARSRMLAALHDNGSVAVPFLGHSFTLQVDAPAVMAASNILQSRLSPVAPVTRAQADSWLMREAASSLGINSPNPTSQQIADALFGMADKQMKAQLAQSLAPLAADPSGTADSVALAAKVLAAVPPPVAALLKQNYGVNLAGLIPAGMNAAQVKTFLQNGLPDRIAAFLERRAGPQMAGAIAQAVAWAGDLLAREANMTMIQLMLASEELDRLTVDHGEKINDLDLRMAMRSFDMQDERGKGRMLDMTRELKTRLADDAAQDDARLAEKFVLHGRTVLQTLELAPTWPEGLRVEVDDASWMPLMTLYGDGRFFELVERVKARYRARPAPGGLTVAFVYRERSDFGVMVARASASRLEFTLGRPRDEREAEFRLASLDEYVSR